MNSELLDFRNALIEFGKKSENFENVETAYVTFAGKTLQPGRYGRDKTYAKAFLIVSSDGNVFYQNKNGVISNRLTPKAFLVHWQSGMSTYLGQ